MRRSNLLLGLILLSISGAAAAQEYPARVVVHAEHQGGNVVYHYEVRNNGPAEIKRFIIGCDCRALPNGFPELKLPPVTGDVVRRDDVAAWFDLPPEAATQPAGWRARLIRPYGKSGHWIEWTMPSARAGSGITAQRSLAGFVLVLPGTDEAYLSGTFTILPEGKPAASASLALDDTTPPTLSLETHSAAAEPGVTAAVKVVATATDDHDPEPKIVLESVGRSDTAGGPGYVLVYSATDASGNRSTATTRVALPTGAAIPTAPVAPIVVPNDRLPKLVSRPNGKRPAALAVCLGDC
jgi:hypothetical protein